MFGKQGFLVVGFSNFKCYICFFSAHQNSRQNTRAGVEAFPLVGGFILRRSVVRDRFVYENYSARCWYWEVLEIWRKLILTSGLALIGAEGRTYVGMAAMGSGFYAVAHAQARPIPDKFEHLLQLASLVVTFFNLSVGVLLRIPVEMEDFSIDKHKDSIGVTVLLVSANLLVTGMLVCM